MVRTLLYWTALVITLVGLLGPFLVPAVPHAWIWHTVGGVVGIYAAWQTLIGFMANYLPYILGTSLKTEDGRVANKKWVWYSEGIFWILLTPLLMLCWGLVHLLFSLSVPGAVGWTFMVSIVFALFVRKVVEDDIKEEDLWGTLKSIGMIILLIALSSIQWKYNPFLVVHHGAEWLDSVTIVSHWFYPIVAGVFLITSIWEVGKAWLYHRCFSDGTQLGTLSLLGKERLYPIYAQHVDTTPKDVLEHALSCGRLRFTLRGRSKDQNEVHHPVIFGAAFTTDFDTLFAYETRREAEVRVEKKAAAKKEESDKPKKGEDEEKDSKDRPHDRYRTGEEDDGVTGDDPFDEELTDEDDPDFDENDDQDDDMDDRDMEP